MSDICCSKTLPRKCVEVAVITTGTAMGASGWFVRCIPMALIKRTAAIAKNYKAEDALFLTPSGLEENGL